MLAAANTIAERGENASQRYIGKQIATMLKEGRQLSYAFSRLPDYFDASDVNIVRSGEASGNLVKVLSSLSREYHFLRTLQGKYISAMTYPVLLLVISIAAIFVLFIGILPGIFSIASQFPGIEMPAVTRAMIAISDFMKNNVAMILIAIGVICFSLSIAFSSE
ncbi:type II secretion system F family protein [Patescibacteria group bacterium]|nr:type II secretion system F family protein [Patescibacteria group bacterium]